MVYILLAQERVTNWIRHPSKGALNKPTLAQPGAVMPGAGAGAGAGQARQPAGLQPDVGQMLSVDPASLPKHQARGAEYAKVITEYVYVLKYNVKIMGGKFAQ